MKILIDLAKLSEAVAWVAGVLPAKPFVPVLSAVLIDADKETQMVKLAAFDYETSATITVDAQVDQPGQALISGRLLADLVRTLPALPVTISADKDTTHLVCGGNQFNMQMLPLDEYPALPKLPEAAGRVPGDLFAKMAGQVGVAASRDELVPAYMGIKLESTPRRLKLSATDRYRAATGTIGWEPIGGEVSMLIPARVMREVAKAAADTDTVEVCFDAKDKTGTSLAGFDLGSRQLTTRLLDGQLPEGLGRLFKVPATVKVRASSSELLAATRRIKLVAERNTPLRMVIGVGEVTLQASTGDLASGTATIEAVVDGDTMTVSFNPQYLEDALGAIPGRYTLLTFQGPGKPCLMQGIDQIDADPEGGGYQHMIMLMGEHLN